MFIEFEELKLKKKSQLTMISSCMCLHHITLTINILYAHVSGFICNVNLLFASSYLLVCYC